MKNLFFLFAAAFLSTPLFAENGADAGGGLSQLVIVMGLMFVFFYFILYRPEKKRRKRVEQQRSSMKKGDHVTAMGILGTIHAVKDQTVIVKMVDGAKVEFMKAAITDVKPPEGEPAKQESAEEPQKS